MLQIIKNIPNIEMDPLTYVFEHIKLRHKTGTLWMEFGVAGGKTINYISSFTKNRVHGFDSFRGLPEDWRGGFPRGTFNLLSTRPKVNNNVVLIKGLFDKTLPNFIRRQRKKISFIHIDCDLYSSTKCIFDNIKKYIDTNCIVVFDELVNYSGFDGTTGELKAFYEFLTNNNVKYSFIGMNGIIVDTNAIDYCENHQNQKVAVIIHSVDC
jgi:hypothetical protein